MRTCFFHRNVTPIPLQKERRQRELERKKEEKGAREFKEKPEVGCDPCLFRQDIILTPSQKKRRNEFKREEEEKKARERTDDSNLPPWKRLVASTLAVNERTFNKNNLLGR